jgi:hypothetical protein
MAANNMCSRADSGMTTLLARRRRFMAAGHAETTSSGGTCSPSVRVSFAAVRLRMTSSDSPNGDMGDITVGLTAGDVGISSGSIGPGRRRKRTGRVEHSSEDEDRPESVLSDGMLSDRDESASEVEE